MTGYDRVVAIIKSESSGADELSKALVETLLETRFDRLVDLDRSVDVGRITDRLLEEIQGLSGPVNFSEFGDISEETGDDEDPLDHFLGKELNDILPSGVQGFLRDVVTREYRADPDLVRSLMEHPAMRTVMRNVLEETLSEFVRRLSDWMRESDRLPGMSGVWSLFTGFFGLARRYTRQYASRLEERVQDQVDRFVDEMIEEVINKLVEEFCSEELQGDLAEWRETILDVLLDRSIDSYLAEQDENGSKQELRSLFEEVVQSDEFRSGLEQSLSVLIRSVQKQTFRDLLRWAGYEKSIKDSGLNVLRRILS